MALGFARMAAMTLAKVTLHNPVQGHKAWCELWKTAKAHLTAERKLVVTLGDYEDALTDQQRRYYHGYVLTVIAQQVKVKVNGQRYAMPVWKEHYRKEFLGFKTKTEVNPLTGRKHRRRIRQSTEGLGVKGYNTLIEKVTAHASVEFGVEFPVTLGEWIDQETGEVVGVRHG
jgi:hypothetical protein